VEPAPEIISVKIKADYLKGVDKLDDRLFILLDHERVRSDEEITQLESVSKMNG